ncbi:MAG: acyclic terpene utilization AtuA family protein [Roseicyclus sp.]
MRRSVRIGAGAGFADDRIEPALAMAEAGAVDVLVFECLAERTIAREVLARRKDPDAGFNPFLRARMETVLKPCAQHGIRIVSNMGGANPVGAARATVEIAQAHGLGGVRCAAVTGDEVTRHIRDRPGLTLMESGEPVEAVLPDMVSANAYLGADAVIAGLRTGAEVVLTGRVADPSLFLGPAMHALGWCEHDLPRLAQGTVMGHLLECAAQLTGGCFADPLRPEKYVPGMDDIGAPIATIAADGSLEITKLPGTGGRLDRRTATEQLLYEVHDPAVYVTPDCVLDLSEVDLIETGPDRVAVTGARANPAPEMLKVLVAYADGFIGEGEVGYAGIGAVERARLAAQVVQDRLRRRGFAYDEMRVDLIGCTSLHGAASGASDPYEVRLRIAARTSDRKAAAAVGFEVRAMHVNGPTGGGGGSVPSVRDVMAIQSVLVPRDVVQIGVTVLGGAS